MVHAISIVFIVLMAGVITSTAVDLGYFFPSQYERYFDKEAYLTKLNELSEEIPENERTCWKNAYGTKLECKNRDHCISRNIRSEKDGSLMRRMMYCNSVETLKAVESYEEFYNKDVCCSTL